MSSPYCNHPESKTSDKPNHIGMENPKWEEIVPKGQAHKTDLFKINLLEIVEKPVEFDYRNGLTG